MDIPGKDERAEEVSNGVGNRQVSRLRTWLRRWEERTRPVDAGAAAATRRRWDELPDHVKTDAPLVGRRSTGCEGTHGVFPACGLACKLEEDDPADLAARDAWLQHHPGSYLTEPSRAVNAVRIARLLVRHPRLLGIGVAWASRFVGRAGGWWALRHGIRPVTFVMHSFIDAALVAPAWALLQRGEAAGDPSVLAAQERLQACVYAMAHPETGEIVPGCVQHCVLDPGETERLVDLLPRRPARHR